VRIGVVTPAYNVAPFIGDAIASMLAQSHTDWRMAVVDDGSDDETVAVASRCPDPRISLIRQPHAGVSAARNRGAAALDAEALLFLDADDWLAPDALAVLGRTLAARPWAAAAAGAYVRVRPGTPHAARPRRPPDGDLLARILARNPFANGGHLLIWQQAAEAAGPFRTDLHYGEDWEYWVRIALQGEFAAVPERHPLCFVRERPGSAYLRMAEDPASFEPSMQAVFTIPALQARFGTTHLAALRRRAEAEKFWVVGRELIRHGKGPVGRRWLHRSVAAAPSLKRIALAAAADWIGLLPEAWRGPFRPYRI
jgi:glycosyltransferase involved in cell wall biosynthesis